MLGLPTGSTPLGMYRKLVEYYKDGHISFKFVKTFNMDEYASKRALYFSFFRVNILSDSWIIKKISCQDIPRQHPESYHYFMWSNFFKHIDIDPSNAHILDGNAADLNAECESFNRKLKMPAALNYLLGELDRTVFSSFALVHFILFIFLS